MKQPKEQTVVQGRVYAHYVCVHVIKNADDILKSQITTGTTYV